MITIRIKHYAFQVSRPYQAGTVLTAEEAQALNALRADNLRNNFARRVARAEEASGKSLEKQALDELQVELTQYDAGYAFGGKGASAPREGALNREARQVAEEMVDAMHNAILHEVSATTKEQMIKEVLAGDAPWAEATRRIAEREAVVRGALEDLL